MCIPGTCGSLSKWLWLLVMRINTVKIMKAGHDPSAPKGQSVSRAHYVQGSTRPNNLLTGVPSTACLWHPGQISNHSQVCYLCSAPRSSCTFCQKSHFHISYRVTALNSNEPLLQSNWSTYLFQNRLFISYHWGFGCDGLLCALCLPLLYPVNSSELTSDSCHPLC